MEQYTCSLCDHFSATSIGGVLRHVGAVHVHEPHFHLVCGINGCPRTYQNYNSFRKHLRRRHAKYLVTSGCEAPSETSTEDVLPFLGVAETELLDSGSEAPLVDPLQARIVMDQERSRQSAAMFLLKTKEVNGVSQTALNELVEDVSLMVETTVDTIKANVEEVLVRNGIREKIHGLNEVFEMEWLHNPFRGLHSEFLQHQTYKELFQLVVRMPIV